jgi:hypothetical protein
MQYRERDGHEYAVYAVTYAGVDSSIALAGRTVSVEVLIDQYHEQGQEYHVPIGSFHQTYVPQGQSALTLVALSNFQRTSPLVLGYPANESYPYARASFDKGLFWSSVDQAMGRILGKVS